PPVGRYGQRHQDHRPDNPAVMRLHRKPVFQENSSSTLTPPPPPSGPIGLSSRAWDASQAFQIAASGVSSGCSVRRKCTRSHASAGLMSSANDGIGVPSSPVMKIL